MGLGIDMCLRSDDALQMPVLFNLYLERLKKGEEHFDCFPPKKNFYMDIKPYTVCFLSLSLTQLHLSGDCTYFQLIQWFKIILSLKQKERTEEGPINAPGYLQYMALRNKNL